MLWPCPHCILSLRSRSLPETGQKHRRLRNPRYGQPQCAGVPCARRQSRKSSCPSPAIAMIACGSCRVSAVRAVATMIEDSTQQRRSTWRLPLPALYQVLACRASSRRPIVDCGFPSVGLCRPLLLPGPRGWPMSDDHLLRARTRLGLLIFAQILVSCVSLIYVANDQAPIAFQPTTYHIFFELSRL